MSNPATPAKIGRYIFVSADFLFDLWEDSNRLSIFCEAKGTYNCCKRQGLPCRILPPQPRRRGLCIVRDDFFIEKSSLTHAVAPPLRNRSRSSRLFGCKRPHDGFVSLPPCFGFEPSVLLFRFKLADTFLYLLIFCLICGRIRTVCPSFAKQKGHIIVASDKACLVESCHPSHVVADFVSFATTFLLKSHLSLTPSLLLSETGHAQVACSVVNALTTALFRYHPVSGLNRAYCFFHFKLADTFLYLLIFCLIYGRIRTVCPSFAKQKGRRPYGRMKNE